MDPVGDDEQGSGVFPGDMDDGQPAGTPVQPTPVQYPTGLAWQNRLKWGCQKGFFMRWDRGGHYRKYEFCGYFNVLY